MKTLLFMMAMAVVLPGVSQNKGKTLVVYYSRTGNTEAVATHIKFLTGADMFRVETMKAYPEAYRATTDVAKEEKKADARPEIKGRVENMAQYDTVFIGFPIWWGTYPMAMATFMDNHNLEGKTVIPFCTHGGGGVDKGFTDVAKSTPKSTQKDGLSLSGSSAASSRAEIEKWLREIEVIR